MVAHPDITRSSNLNFGAVVLEKRRFEQLQLSGRGDTGKLPET